MFVRPAEDPAKKLDHPKFHLGIPVIDLGGLSTTDLHVKIVDEIRTASEKWGFFQVVNHGIPIVVLENMIAGIRRFNEANKEFYERHRTREVKFKSNYDLFQSQTVGWRDSLTISMINSSQIDLNDLSAACRDVAIEFINYTSELRNKILDLLSEGLRLKPDHLRSIECNEGKRLLCHYYPECPEPDLAIGITEHSDNLFLTNVAQDHTVGLQVLHKINYMWSLFQLVSNDKFKSNMHRVLPSLKPRVSAAFFFSGRFAPPA